MKVANSSTATCILCHQAIERYDPAFHRLKIREDHPVDICKECIEKFLHWQQHAYAALFPTKMMKRMAGRETRADSKE